MTTRRGKDLTLLTDAELSAELETLIKSSPKRAAYSRELESRSALKVVKTPELEDVELVEEKVQQEDIVRDDVLVAPKDSRFKLGRKRSIFLFLLVSFGIAGFLSAKKIHSRQGSQSLSVKSIKLQAADTLKHVSQLKRS